MCFKTYLNHQINQKTSQKKNNLRQSQFSKKRGGVRRGMIMITDSMGFFCYPFPNTVIKRSGIFNVLPQALVFCKNKSS